MIRIVWGTGEAHTALASFDVALADAGVHQYNLRYLSSVIPAGAEVDVVGSAPDLGPVGQALDVVCARQTSPPGARASAGLAWARADDGTGIFYEAADHDPETVDELLQTGIERGCALRGISTEVVETRTVTCGATADQYATAVCLGVYGESTPIL